MVSLGAGRGRPCVPARAASTVCREVPAQQFPAASTTLGNAVASLIELQQNACQSFKLQWTRPCTASKAEGQGKCSTSPPDQQQLKLGENMCWNMGTRSFSKELLTQKDISVHVQYFCNIAHTQRIRSPHCLFIPVTYINPYLSNHRDFATNTKLSGLTWLSGFPLSHLTYTAKVERKWKAGPKRRRTVMVTGDT